MGRSVRLAAAPPVSTATDLPRRRVDHIKVPWSTFVSRFDWRQGEHIAVCGPTGMGKTTLILQLAPMRQWTCIVATKPRDKTLDRLRRRHNPGGRWRMIPEWPPLPTDRRVILWPRQLDLTRTEEVRLAVLDGLRAMYRATSWCIVLDDLQALTDTLNIGGAVRHLLLNGRSVGISVIGSTQRPRWVPRELWTQATHLFLGRTIDADDLKAISGIGHADPKAVRMIVQNLDRHEVLYVNTRTGMMCVTQAPAT